MKTPSEDLFELIQSLSRTEKTYFKKFSKLHVLGEENNYIPLFDAIAKQQNYDEEELREKFKGQRFLLHFWSAKKYLYDLIIKSLEQYHKSISAELYSLLHQVEILFEKNLLTQAERAVVKGIKLSTQYEMQLLLVEFLNWEKQLMRRNTYNDISYSGLKSIFDRTQLAIDQYMNAEKYDRVSNDLFFKLSKAGLTREKEKGEYLERIISSKLLSNEKSADSFNAKVNFNTINYIYYNVKGNFEKAFQYNARLVALYEENPLQIKKDFRGYVTILINSAISITALKRFGEIPDLLQKIRSLDTNSNAIKKFILLHTNLREIESYYLSGDLSEKKANILSMYAQIKNKEIDLSDNVSYEVLYYYTLGSYLFVLRQFKEVNFLLNKILNEYSSDIFLTIHCFARIMVLLVYFETGKWDLLNQVINSTYRYLNKKQKLYQLENIFIVFFKKAIVAEKKGDILKPLFIELRKEVKRAYINPYEANAERYFNFLWWIESKIEKKPFAEIVKEKANAV